MRKFCLLALVSQFCLPASSLAELQLEDYKIESTHLPDDERFHPPIGNGHIATNVRSDTVYMNGLFNGYEDKSSRARIPAYVSADVTKEDDINRIYVLDMYEGLFKQRIEKSSYNVEITYSAHRSLTRLLVTTVQLNRKANSTEGIRVKLMSNQGPESSDFFTINQTFLTQSLDGMVTKYYHGRTKETEVNSTEPFELHVYYTALPAEIGLQQSEESKLYVFIASHSMQQKDALDNFEKALTDSDSLLQSHKNAWHKVWAEGRVDISGSPELSKNVIAATYNILCSLPTQDDPIAPFFGLSPGGLSRGGLLVPEMPGGGHNDYAGHIFWDMDTWMMPPIMLLHPDMGRQMISSRIRVLEQVKRNSIEAGYKGAKFPWEQAITGIEATPKWAGQMSQFEIHINADISYSLRQYLYANDDVTLVTWQRGFELALEIARFWQSRANRTGPNKIEILGVMGPDEYHYNIDNSVYTNYNAKLSLQLPQYIVDKFHLTLNASLQTGLTDFNNTANDLIVLFDERLRYHPQYEGFNLSNQIKQSDVVLLGYPLMMPMSRDVRLNDLELYENITNSEGPDTGTWSMHTVGWLELGYQERAHDTFKLMLRNINEPFKVFSEKPVTNTSTGGCVNFITAAGGLLQSIIFGYGGIRLEPDRLLVHPSQIPNTTGHSLIGIHYRSAVLSFHYNATTDTVALDVRKHKDARVVIRMETEGFQNPTEIFGNDEFVYKNQKASIEVFLETSPTIVTSHTFSAGSTFFPFCTNIGTVFAFVLLLLQYNK